MTAFITRILAFIFIGSLWIDIAYGGFSIGTLIVGVLFLAAFIYWFRTSPAIHLCKFCTHDKGEHRGYSRVGSRRYDGLCVNGYKNYGYEGIYGHCGCWRFTPSWMFWIKKKR